MSGTPLLFKTLRMLDDNIRACQDAVRAAQTVLEGARMLRDEHLKSLTSHLYSTIAVGGVVTLKIEATAQQNMYKCIIEQESQGGADVDLNIWAERAKDALEYFGLRSADTRKGEYRSVMFYIHG